MSETAKITAQECLVNLQKKADVLAAEMAEAIKSGYKVDINLKTDGGQMHLNVSLYEKVKSQ